MTKQRTILRDGAPGGCHRVRGDALVRLLAALLLALAGGVPTAAAAEPPLHFDAVPTVRLAGPDRVATAVEVSRHGWDSASVALLATAGAFPDALAGAALARRLDAPLLLTPAGGLPPPVAAELVRLGVQRVVLLGGPAAISEAVADQVAALGTAPAVARIAGPTRYATAAAIAEEVGPSGVVTLASGERFADALAASSLTASADGAAILLTEAIGLPAATRDALIGLQERGADQVVVIGGPAAVSDGVLEEVSGLGLDSVRLAGATRYDTALRVLDHVLGSDPAAPARSLVVSTGERFADALAAGALTAREGAVFATVPPTWPRDLHAGLRAHAGRVDALVVVGGESAVPPHVVAGVLRAVGDQPWFDDPVDPLGLVWDQRYANAFSRGEDPWSIWACHVPPDTADTTMSPERLPVDLQHVQAAADALAQRWSSVISGGRWRPTFSIGGEVTVPAEEAWVRGGCLQEALDRLPSDTPVRGLLIVMDAVSGVSVGGVNLFDTCDEERCGVDRSVHITRRHAVLPAQELTTFDGMTSLVVLAHELGHAFGWPHVYRPNADGDQYEDPMDLMASAAGWRDGEWLVAPGTLAFNRYAAGWIDPGDVAVHRGGSATYHVTALGSEGVQLIAVPALDGGALLTLEARVWDSIDRGLPAEGVEVAIVDQRGYPCGAEVGTCSGYRRMAPALGRLWSADHVLRPGQGADVLGLRIDVVGRDASTFTVTVSGGPPDVPHFVE